MNKEIYLIRGKDNESYQTFKERIINTVLSLKNELKPEAIRFTITEKSPPKFSVIPYSKKKIAAISIYKESVDPVEQIEQMAGFYGAYKVEEALPVAYQKNWNDGEPTPGACLLTLFRKKASIEYTTFIYRWHNGHTPLTLRIHPLWNYNRNVVLDQLYDQAAKFDGIVEEQVKKASDLLNPFKFFGNPLIIIYRMLLVYFDTKSFIDYKSMETYFAAEYHIKS